MRLQIGQPIDRFQIELELGRGSIARVYRVADLRGGQTLALKSFDEALARDAGFQRGVLELSLEPTTKGQSSLVQLGEARQIGDLLLLPMEHMAGGSLVGLLQRPPPSRRELVGRLRLFAAAAEALAVLHALGVPHGSVAPGNLLLSAPPGDPAAALKLGDFNLAIHAATRIGRLVGNPIYFAPEHFDAQLVPASDIYSLGIVLYEAITGQPPFQCASMSEAAQKHRHEPPPGLSQFQHGLPSSLEALVLRCLAKEPAARFASGSELLHALQQTINELDPPPPPLFEPTIVLHGLTPAVLVYDAQRRLIKSYHLQPGETTVGRKSSSMIVLPVNDTIVSRLHLLITWDGQQVRVTDCSANGTLRQDATRLNLRVAEPWAWNEELRIGEFTLVLHPPPASDPLATLVETKLPATQVPTQLIANLPASSAGREGWWRRMLRRIRS